MELPGCLFFENKQKTFKLKSRPRGQPRILRKVSIKFNTYISTYELPVTLTIFFSKIGYFSWMNFRNSKNNLSRYTNGLVFTKAGEYGEFFYLRELVCNLWQVMSSVVERHNTSEDFWFLGLFTRRAVTLVACLPLSKRVKWNRLNLQINPITRKFKYPCLTNAVFRSEMLSVIDLSRNTYKVTNQRQNRL